MIFKKSLKLITTFVAFFLLFSSLWTVITFDNPSFEQVLYQLQFGIDGVIDVDKAIILRFILVGILLPFIATIIIFCNLNILNRLVKIIHFIINRPIFFLLLSFFFALIELGAIDFIARNIASEDYFAHNYINPKDVEIQKPAKTKNLIMIYVESLEDTFSKPHIFGEDLLEKISQYEIGGTYFNAYKQVLGAHWTMAAIVATQCGVPLKPSFLVKGEIKGAKNMLANAKCMGDILKDDGYENIFINGLSLRFNGTGLFFKDHGYDKIYGIDELLAQGFKPKELNQAWSSIYDKDILEISKSIVDEKEKAKSPYNLTILTLDMHAPKGHVSSSCGYNDKTRLARSVLCTSDALADFINHLKKQGYLKNTEVVILGDHLFMPMDDKSKKEIFFNKNRTIFNRFFSADKLTPNRDELLAFDLFPTILYNLGFKTSDGRLGLGYSGFGEYDQPAANRYEEMQKKLLNYSDKYQELWAK